MPIPSKLLLSSFPTYAEIRNRKKVTPSTTTIKTTTKTSGTATPLITTTTATPTLAHSETRKVIRPIHEWNHYVTAPRKLTRKERKRKQWLQSLEEKANGTGERKYYGNWNVMPDLVLEQIYLYLSLSDKVSCSYVCLQWSRVIRFHSIWNRFIVNDHFMTRSRYDYVRMEYDTILDASKASDSMNELITKARSLLFLPQKNLFVLCAFQAMMIRWCKLHGELANIQSFTYVFPCNFGKKSNEIDIYGTGGPLLEDLKRVLTNLTGLKQFELKNLELDEIDASHILDEVGIACSHRITTLKMINISRLPFEMLEVTSFVNLRDLFISPHNIGPELVEAFGSMEKLQNVILVVNSFTECKSYPVDPRVWRICRRNNPRLRVHFLTEGKKPSELNFQEGAPVKSIVFDSTHVKISTFTIYEAIELFKSDLECIAFCQLPRYYMPRSLHERADVPFLHLLQECPYVHTLMIRERLSSASVILMAITGKNLRNFHVRKNAILLRCDWPRKSTWDQTFYDRLKKSSRSYDKMEKEVSRILGFRWFALCDRQFKQTTINMTSSYYVDGYE